ncbi:MAG: hypothetical protein A3F67_07985 [Verrucomicrobia bacterium RIFCSPHIGHO2_12_FULL_41_10]|nr:MAG: hypothetical protein A3F67_07985 [Verrucomicrobia bacterium RIFCSPHIGHO2_12_FULL_41_10]HLB33789.1 hypothetical protein [Chthoniobacterales bacterium]
MSLLSRFLLCLLLLAFLQPWRLVASTPAADGVLKYVAEEETFLVEEVTGEEGFINELPLNAAQTGLHAIEEGAFIAAPAFSSSFTEVPATGVLVEPPVSSLDEIVMDQVSLMERANKSTPQASNLGDHTLKLPQGLIANFLRSLEAKQAVYKAEHQQTAQELQTKYPELVQQIDAWKWVVDAWNGCSTPEAKAACYQNVAGMTFSMPSELYRLVALSQAMKIMEDAIAYIHHLSSVLKEDGTNPFFTEINVVNSDVQHLEKAVDAIMRLSEQRNRCLTLAAKTDIKFKEAAVTAQEAIASYSQFAQEMKEGDAPAAFLFYVNGFSLEFKALKSELEAQGATKGYKSYQFMINDLKPDRINDIEKLPEKAAQARREDAIEAADAFEQAACYYLQAVQAAVNEPKTDHVCSFISKIGGDFSLAAFYTSIAAKTLQQAALAKHQGYEEAMKMFEKAADYQLQAAQVHSQAAKTAASADSKKADSFFSIAWHIRDAAGSFEKAAEVKREGLGEVATVFEQAANYYLQAAKTCSKEGAWEGGDFSQAGEYANHAARSLKQAAQARSEGKAEAVSEFDQAVQAFFQAVQSSINGGKYDSIRIHYQDAYYHQWRAEIYRQEGVEQGDAFSRQIFDDFEKLYEKIIERRSTFNIEDYKGLFYELCCAGEEYKLALRAVVDDGDLEAARAHQQKAYEHYERGEILYGKWH